MFTDLLGDELGTFILVGARFQNSSKLALAAMGRRSIVLDTDNDGSVVSLASAEAWNDVRRSLRTASTGTSLSSRLGFPIQISSS
mmetsp:Transcript_18862/g.61911  ORF Transcript_18862/g.61911 Transcript_18862/m.61911 type:complete len:85 (+) Transcript_18862:502-756(+)